MYMGILRQTDGYTREVGKDANIVISADFNADSNAHYSQAFPTAYTPEQESRLAALDNAGIQEASPIRIESYKKVSQ